MWRIPLLIQAFMGVLDTRKTEDDPFKNEGARVVIKKISHCTSMQIIITVKGSLINSLRLVLLKVQTHLRF